jgi:hypothetical protein
MHILGGVVPAKIIDIRSIDVVGLGTLLLAIATFLLAFLTWRLLKAAKDDRRIALQALVASERQADISDQALSAADRTATEAARARIDEAAPLLGLIVTLGPLVLPESDRFGARQALPDDVPLKGEGLRPMREVGQRQQPTEWSGALREAGVCGTGEQEQPETSWGDALREPGVPVRS